MSFLSSINTASTTQPCVPQIQPEVHSDTPTGNVSVFVPGAMGLSFGALAQVKAIAAQMGVSALQLLQSIVPQLAAFNEAAKKYKLDQADKQEELGNTQFGMNLATAAITFGGAAAEFGFNRSAMNGAENEINTKNPPQAEAIFEEEEIEMTNMNNSQRTLNNPEAAEHVTIETGEEAATLDTQGRSPQAAARNNTKKRGLSSEEADKIRDSAAKKSASQTMMIQNITQGSRALSDAIGSLCIGRKNKDITEAEGYSSFNSGAMQTTSQLLTLLGQVTQSRETLEQGSEQSIRAIIQTSGAA